MKSFLLGSLGAALILLGAGLGVVWQRQHTVAPINFLPTNYELHQGGELGLTFVFDKGTGRTWRYYRNADNSEGMTELGYRNLSPR